MMRAKSNIGPGRRSSHLPRFKAIIWKEENNFVVFDIKSHRKLKESDGIIVPMKNEYNETINQEETNSMSNASVDTLIDYFNYENQFQNENLNSNQNQDIAELNEFSFDYCNNYVEDINFNEEFNFNESDFSVFNEKEYFNPSEQNETDYSTFF